MGQTSKKLHDKLTKRGIPGMPTGKMPRGSKMPDIQALIKQGMDPTHAAYIIVQNLTSFFAEEVSGLPEMKNYAQIVAKAEDSYLPSGPPMSPMTKSYFTCWAFFDLRFHEDETLGSCTIESTDEAGLNPDQLDALKIMADSRMGIYEHAGMNGKHVQLRELTSDAEFNCHPASGYRGKRGELWYVRLLPPLHPRLADYHIVYTTPYILMASKNDWLRYFGRRLPGRPNDRESLHRFLKYGLDPNYWNEFIFCAYHGHQHDAIFLTGIPDLKETLPHA